MHTPSPRALWAERLAMLGWLTGLGFGLVVILYASPLGRLSLLDDPEPLSVGFIAAVVNYHYEVTLWGVNVLALFLRFAPFRKAPPGERLAALARLLETQAVAPALFMICVALLIAMQGILGAEIFDHAFGERLSRAWPAARELLGLGTICGAGLVAAAIVLRGAGTPPAIEARSDPPSRARLLLAATLLAAGILAPFVSFDGPMPRPGGGPIGVFPDMRWNAQDQHMEALRIMSRAAALLVLGLVVLTDRPGKTARAWCERHTGTLLLVGVLELTAVLVRHEQYVELYWLSWQTEHVPEHLALFPGHIQNALGLAFEGACLTAGCLVLVAALRRRATAPS